MTRIAFAGLSVLLGAASLQAQAPQEEQPQSEDQGRTLRREGGEGTVAIREAYRKLGYINLPAVNPRPSTPSCSIPLVVIPPPAGAKIRRVPANPSIDPKFVSPPASPSCPPSVRAPKTPPPAAPGQE